MSSNSRRRLLAAVGASLVAALARGAAPGNHRLGFLNEGARTGPDLTGSQLADALAKLGYVERRNLASDWRFAENDSSRLVPLAKELVAGRPNVIVSMGTPATRALQQATRVIPVVCVVADPLRSGFAKKLAKPGGNITGLALGSPEVAVKQLQILRSVVPGLKRLEIVVPSGTPEFVDAAVAEARRAGIEPTVTRLGNVDDVERGWSARPASRPDAMLVLKVFLPAEMAKITNAANRRRIPTMFAWEAYVESGGLMSYNVAHRNVPGRLAALIDRIFAGGNPAEMPFELPTDAFLAINRKTAAAIGVRIPDDLLYQANRVVD